MALLSAVVLRRGSLSLGRVAMTTIRHQQQQQMMMMMGQVVPSSYDAAPAASTGSAGDYYDVDLYAKPALSMIAEERTWSRLATMEVTCPTAPARPVRPPGGQ